MQVQAKGVKKEYIRKGSGTNLFTAVYETDFRLEEGRITAIRGRSGSGKTTLLNMLAGILSPTSGNVYYGEQDLYAMNDEALSAFRNRRIGYIPQGTSAISSLTILENILLPYQIRGGGARAQGNSAVQGSTAAQAGSNTAAGGSVDAYAKQLMEELSIAHLADEKPDRLSGGELRRMVIARALILQPDVLLADEPTGDLDDENTQIVFSMFKKCAAQGASVLIVTHEEDVEAYADAVYRMDAGRLTGDKA